ncbi:MAG: hypothetical protein C0404_05910 [Verrucomicrobia bacterium]|nr:hypothetical protein [Verrucomicrobiota bacterium]
MHDMSIIERTDKELLAIYSGQGPDASQAFSEIVKRRGSQVYQTCLRVTRERHLAEDAAQSTFLVLARKAGRVWTEPGIFLHSVAVRVSKVALRKEAVRREKESAAMKERVEQFSGQSMQAEWNDVGREIDEAIELLPGRQREAVILHYIHGKSRSEVSCALGISDQAVATHIDRAVQKLRSWLTMRGITVTAPALAVMLAEESASSGCPEFLAAMAPKLAAAGTGAGMTAGLSSEVLKLGGETLKNMVWGNIKMAAGIAASLMVVGGVTVAVAQFGGNADTGKAGPAPASSGSGAVKDEKEYTGKVLYVEHYAYVRVGVPEGLGGPAKQACKAHAWAFCTQDKAGNFYVAEPQNDQVHWIDREGTDRIIAGDGRKGFRDGPGTRARFDFGCGSYNDLQLHCDDAGSVYVADGMNNRLRKIFRKEDGSWHVTTVSGGGTRRLKKGESAAATDLQFGCATRWGLSPDGKIAAYANYGGVYKVLIQENKASLVASGEDVKKDVGDFQPSWHVDGGFITSDSAWYYWAPTISCGLGIVRCNLATGKCELVAGGGPKKANYDGTGVKDCMFHTVFATYSPDASVIYVGGGDEFACRRIYAGKVMHLMKDGSWKQQNTEAGAWQFGGSGLYLGRDSKLYTVPPPYSWPGWITRATFGKE